MSYYQKKYLVVTYPSGRTERLRCLIEGGSSVFGALASFGYDAQWDCIPAGRLGAPHERDRVWINAADATSEQGIYEPHNWQTSYRLPDDGSAWKTCPWNAPEECVCRMDDGLSYRVYRAERLGNTVVPKIPEIIGHAILAAEDA